MRKSVCLLLPPDINIPTSHLCYSSATVLESQCRVWAACISSQVQRPGRCFHCMRQSELSAAAYCSLRERVRFAAAVHVYAGLHCGRHGHGLPGGYQGSDSPQYAHARPAFQPGPPPLKYPALSRAVSLIMMCRGRVLTHYCRAAGCLRSCVMLVCRSHLMFQPTSGRRAGRRPQGGRLQESLPRAATGRGRRGSARAEVWGACRPTKALCDAGYAGRVFSESDELMSGM